MKTHSASWKCSDTSIRKAIPAAADQALTQCATHALPPISKINASLLEAIPQWPVQLLQENNSGDSNSDSYNVLDQCSTGLGRTVLRQRLYLLLPQVCQRRTRQPRKAAHYQLTR